MLIEDLVDRRAPDHHEPQLLDQPPQERHDRPTCPTPPFRSNSDPLVCHLSSSCRSDLPLDPSAFSGRYLARTRGRGRSGSDSTAASGRSRRVSISLVRGSPAVTRHRDTRVAAVRAAAVAAAGGRGGTAAARRSERRAVVGRPHASGSALAVRRVSTPEARNTLAGWGVCGGGSGAE
jgi:hypothetical protein